jgi:hypothetical protein
LEGELIFGHEIFGGLQFSRILPPLLANYLMQAITFEELRNFFRMPVSRSSFAVIFFNTSVNQEQLISA